MGDRGQVLIKDEGVYLYTHWGATNLVGVVASSLSRQERWDDPEYLARIIFCEMVIDDVGSPIGYGIGTQKHGDVWRVIELDCGKQTATVIDYDKCVFEGTFEQFISDALKLFDPTGYTLSKLSERRKHGVSQV